MLLAQSEEFIADSAEYLAGIGQQVFQVSDKLLQFLMFILELSTLQRGQSSQRHIQNCLCLNLREAEFAHQIGARRVHPLAAANRLDHFVEDVERLEQPFNNM